MDRRKKDANWLLNLNVNGTVPTCDAQLAVLMDIRDELKKLNWLLSCENFLQIPALLRMIRANTAKPKKQKKPTA